MGVPGSANLLLLGGQQGYQISRSLRFNSADSAYLNRTPASAGNRRTFTWSGWVKRSKLGDENKTFTAGSGGTITYLQFQDNVTDGLTFARYTGTHTFRLSTTQVFRDSSAWYHITLAVDTTQAIDTNRVKIYVNGTQITVFTTATYPAQNLDLEINNTNDHRIGSGTGSFSASGYLDGYLTEIHFIDGQALTPSSFGETDATTGSWKPKRYTGTYGTNGFYLNFSDNSGTTSTTLGKDSSGNGNNWTPNNFSVTAGAGNDSMIDTPTPYADGGNGRGNYCVLNPLTVSNPVTPSDAGTLSNGNLTLVTHAGTGSGAAGTFAVNIPTGQKWYWEVTPTSGVTAASQAAQIGIANGGSEGFPPTISYNYWSSDTITYTNGDVIGVAFDGTASQISFYKNGTLAKGPFSASNSNPLYPIARDNIATSITYEFNFGQRPFAYTPPSGFVALNTQNLPEPSIKKPSAYMDVKLYSGTNASQSITGLGFSPDLIWFKNRTGTAYHGLFDSVRGRAAGLSSNVTDAESTSSAGNDLVSFDANGFTLGPVQNWNSTNGSGNSIVAWCWDESATPGFDIVTYTGNGTARTIAHSLGVAPKMIIVKDRTSGTNNWIVGHDSIAWTNRLYLNDTSASTAASTTWNNTAPTSSVFSVGTSTQTNTNSNNYVAYLWSEVAGFSKFGSYTGNGSSDGPFVFCGFRPRWILIKTSSTTGNWHVMDAVRETSNAITARLFPNLNNAEQTGSTDIDFLSNGFKIRNNISGFNDNGVTHVYAAFAEAPFKYSLAR
jgi:hypothetical protein